MCLRDEMNRRRVLLVCDDLENGGMQRQLATLAGALPTEWERRVFSIRSGPYLTVLRDAGIVIDVAERRHRRDISPAWPLWALLHSWRPDVVHAWGWMGSTASLIGCRALGIAHVDGSIRRGMVTRAWYDPLTLGLRGADLVISNSLAGLCAWRIPERRGRVVHNGFDPARLPLCKPDDRPQAPFTVVMTGRMVPAKDFSTFVRAARAVTGGVDTSWKFIAVGSGPDRARLAAEAGDLMSTGIVTLVDGGLEVLNHVRRAHVGVLMTNARLHAEGCSNSILEYMACGLPVVCSDGGGNREVVVDGETGLFVPAGGAEGLAHALRVLRLDPRLTERLGSAGRDRLRVCFSLDAMVAGTVAVYEEALAGRVRSAARHRV